MRYFQLLLASCLITLAVCAPQTAEAQRHTLPKWEARLGLGLLPTFIKDEVKTLQPPLSLELRYRPLEKLSVGLLTGQSVSRGLLAHHNGEKRLVTNRFQTTALRIAAHSNPWERWEVYGGLVFGYSRNNIEYMEPLQSKNLDNVMPIAPKRDGFTYTAFVGSSMKVSKRLMVYGELGFGLSILTSGISYRF
ncbi:MAG: hypothetical protein D6772_17625 [Bacteroidetes bacterium]|nr:MAG: hypothetical protein D6772_17625 [Bacteroidota bacterium]